MRLGDLNVGDKFRFSEDSTHYNYGRPYLLIDLNFDNISRYTDFSNLVATLDLVTYKIVGFNKELEVEQDKDNIYV